MKRVIINSVWLKKNYTEELFLIGEGAFSKVYEFDDPKEKDPVWKKKAIKVIQKSSDDDMGEWGASVQGEIENLEELKDCPNIIKIIDSNIDFKNGGSFYIVMEWAKSNLCSILEKQKSLEKLQLINLLQSMLKGALSAHKNNIIHNDLKPANILQLPNEEFVIADFGVSKKFGFKKNNIEKEKFSFEGTLAYMAPEFTNESEENLKQYNEKTPSQQKEIGKRGDIYSLGLIVLACCGVPEQVIFQKISKYNEEEHAHDLYQLWKNYVVDKNLNCFFALICMMCSFENESRPGADKLLGLISSPEGLNKLNDEFRNIEEKYKAKESGNFKELLDVINDLKKNPRRALINFKGCDALEDSSFDYLINCHFNSSVLEYLYVDLSYTLITNQGVCKLAQFLKHLVGLKVIRIILDRVKITDECLENILQGNFTDLSLSLVETKITDKTLKIIEEALKKMKTLMILDLVLRYYINIKPNNEIYKFHSYTRIEKSKLNFFIKNLPITSPSLRAASIDISNNSMKKGDFQHIPEFIIIIDSEDK